MFEFLEFITGVHLLQTTEVSRATVHEITFWPVNTDSPTLMMLASLSCVINRGKTMWYPVPLDRSVSHQGK